MYKRPIRITDAYEEFKTFMYETYSEKCNRLSNKDCSSLNMLLADVTGLGVSECELHPEFKNGLDEDNPILLNRYNIALVLKDNEDGFCCVKKFNTRKIVPKKTTTPTIADIVYNTQEHSNADVYMWLHTVPYKSVDVSVENGVSQYALILDIDNFPVWKYSKDEAINAIFEHYPMLKELNPNYIVDSGNKGFHVYFLFDRDIIKYKKLMRAILTPLNMIFKGDPAKNGGQTAIAMPTTINKATGNERRILFSQREYSDRHNIVDFYEKVKSICHEYIYVYNEVHQEREVFSKNDLDKITYEYLGMQILCDIYSDSIDLDTYCEKENIFIKEDEYLISSDIKRAKKNKGRYERFTKSLYDRDEKVLEKNHQNLAVIHKKRISDIYKHLDRVSNEVTGSRHAICFNLACLYRLLGTEEDKCLDIVLNVNSRFSQPMNEREIINTVRGVYRKEEPYKVKNTVLHSLIRLDDSVLQESFCSYTEIDRRNRKVWLNKRYYAASVKGKIADKNKKKRNKKIVAMINLMKQGTTILSALAKELGVCKSTVRNWINKYAKNVIPKFTFVMNWC